MSRRITFVALAASVSLIATQASADRECFDESCRLQEAAEAQAAAQAQQAAAQAQASPEVAAPASKPASSPLPDFVAPETAAAATDADASQARADAKAEAKYEAKPEPKPEPKLEAKAEPKVESKPEPVLVPSATTTTKLQPYSPPPVVVKSEPAVVLPPVVAEPAVRRPQPQLAQPQISPSQAATRYEPARVRRDEPRVPIPQYAERPQPPVAAPLPARPVRSVPPAAARVERAPITVPGPSGTARVERTPAVVAADYAGPRHPVVVDVPRQAPSTAGAAVIEVPGEIQTGDGLVTVYPNLRPDPAWKLCQIDSRDLGRRAYRCTAYSYHPYGEGGYRPYGTYRNYPTAPGYVVAPNARIISIEQND